MSNRNNNGGFSGYELFELFKLYSIVFQVPSSKQVKLIQFKWEET